MDTDTKYFTPEQYILASVEEYPSLYASTSYESAKMKVLDQLFNVNGNGIRDSEELAEELAFTPTDFEHAKKYLTGEQTYYGYYKMKDYGTFQFPENTPDDLSGVLESERVNYPKVVHWQACSLYEFTNPYPNFKKDYSIVWRSNFKDYGQDWINAAIDFYTKCKEYFEGDCSTYHYAYPRKTEGETRQTRDSYQKTMKDKTPEDIEKGYGVPYDGDLDKFITARWMKEKARILSFIDETIEMLKN